MTDTDLRTRTSIPARKTGPMRIVDTQALRTALILALDTPELTSDKASNLIRPILKDTQSKALDDVRTQFEAGHLNGLETARVLASVYDDLISVLFDVTQTHIFPTSDTEAVKMLSLCAQGGYGRGELAPQSDLDLLFIPQGRNFSQRCSQITEFILYMLWDLGLKVGHASRTIDQNIQLAKTDQTILTALLDLRHLAGNADITEKLFKKFRAQITWGKGRKYIAAKLEERDKRHAREGNSRYVIEPNIKEGKGGLRDLHVLYWITRYLDQKGEIVDPQRGHEYVNLGLFDTRSAQRFNRAADFLWRTRIHLHYATQRPTETLSFEHQIILARKMGHASGPIEEAVEKFMREYFTNAREVGVLTRIACAKLEADNALRLPKGLEGLAPSSRKKVAEPDFEMRHGRLMFKDPLKIRERPAMIMELFEIAGRHNHDIHPDALAAIDFRRNLIDNQFRRDPHITEIFLNILMGSKAPYATLKVMNEAGVLGRYMLEFGHIVARTQFNMHHAYTVDEHTLRLVDHFDNLEKGRYAADNPIATKICKTLEPRQRRIIYLACLLHDTGKGVGDQCIEGARLARRACRRMGIEQTELESVSWLVRRHLDMSETAQRRDISDPDTIADFAELVGSHSRLHMLYLLTIVDIRAVGPGVWNDWKATLLKNLYEQTAFYLEGLSHLEPAAKAQAVRQQLLERLPPKLSARVEPILEELPNGYWQSFNMLDLVRHCRFYDNVVRSERVHHTYTRIDKKHDITELWVMTQDRSGLFADLCHAIASADAQIVGARLNTCESGRVMNVFYLQNKDGLAFGRMSEQIVSLLTRRTKMILSDTEASRDITPNQEIISRREAAIPITPKVRLLKADTPGTMIVEIEARDRARLLYDIAACLRDQDVNVLSAHIEVMGTLAVDAFYVQLSDKSILSKSQQQALKSELLKAVA